VQIEIKEEDFITLKYFMISTLIQKKSKVLIIVPCGKKKIWDKFPKKGHVYAKDAYISPYFKLCRKYAEKFADKWVIISAKYGFIEPDFTIPRNYDISFNNSKNKVVSVKKLKEQAKKLRFEDYQSVTVLGGDKYAQVIKKALEDFKVQTSNPLKSLGIGNKQAKIKEALTKGISL
jgi:hypothetical protein